MNALDVLKQRGFYKQSTDEKGLQAKLDDGPVTLYVGIDPTGPSCHIGHLIPIYACAHLQRCGHQPIILMGGGTALIGDPSGKTDMRQMIGKDDIDHNIVNIKKQIDRLIDFDNTNAIVENNSQWLRDLNYIEFLREIGRHFSVNRMLTFESYKQRLEKGLSFLEFNYQLLQSYDFLELYRRHKCILQIGGDDQWGNIVAGMELIRRIEGVQTFGLTFPLIARSDGKKMGKTEKGSLFLDPQLTSVYDFFQYWRNVTDQDVEKFLLTFTFLDADECHELGSVSDKAINESKERLAFEVTRILHGQQQAEEARDAVRSVFGGMGGIEDKSIPSTDIPLAEIQEGIHVLELFVRAGLCSSKTEARRLVEQGGARLNDTTIESMEAVIATGDMHDNQIILKAGKKRIHRIKIV